MMRCVGGVILSSPYVEETKGGRLVVKQNPEVVSAAIMYTSFKQVNPPSHPGQPSSLISTNTPSPSLGGNHPERKCLCLSYFYLLVISMWYLVQGLQIIGI